MIGDETGDMNLEDSRFIVAFDPTTVLTLIAEVRRLRAAGDGQLEDRLIARELRLLAAQNSGTMDCVFARGIIGMVGRPGSLSAIDDELRAAGDEHGPEPSNAWKAEWRERAMRLARGVAANPSQPYPDAIYGALCDAYRSAAEVSR